MTYIHSVKISSTSPQNFIYADVNQHFKKNNQTNLLKCAALVCTVAAIGMLFFSSGGVLSSYKQRLNIEELKKNPCRDVYTPPLTYINGTFFSQPRSKFCFPSKT